MADAGLANVVEQVLIPNAPALPRAVALAPSEFIFTGEDALRLTARNSQSGVVVGLHYRQFTDEGTIFATRETLTPTTDRVATTQEFTIGRGALLNVTVTIEAGTPKRGQTFVRLQVIRGLGAAATVLATIVQGYVTVSSDRAWPGSLIEGTLDGDGYTRAVQGTNPAAGAQIGETVPTGARWRLNSLEVDLATDATVATRQPYLYMTYVGVGIGVTAVNPGTLAASGVAGFAWGLGLALSSDMGGLNKTGGLPDVRMFGGSTIQVTASSFQPGDNWAAPVLNVTEWLEES